MKTKIKYLLGEVAIRRLEKRGTDVSVNVRSSIYVSAEQV